jgi:exodeoxyribonuclease V beta subunit
MAELKKPWDSINLDKHGYIDASAGTGKTHAIVNLVARILARPHDNPWKRPIDLEELLIVTYTEKATEELRLRIRQSLGELLTQKDPLPPGTAAHIERCLTRFDRAAIYTIHGFCNRFLGAHAFESLSSFSSEKGDAADLAVSVVRDTVRGPLRALWPDYGALAASLEKWGMTGVNDFCKKTALVIQSYNAAKRDRLCPAPASKQIVSLYGEFQKMFAGNGLLGHEFVKSWGKLKTSLSLRADPKKKVPALSALAAAPRLDTAEEIIAFLSVDTIYPAVIEKDPVDFFLPVAARQSADYRSPAEVAKVMGVYNGRSFQDFTGILGRLGAAVKEHLAAAKFADLFMIFAEAQNRFSRRKQQKGVLTFDDMIVNMHSALTGPNTQLLSVLRKRFRYGIIDEFQDANTLQWEIFKKIFVDDNAGRPFEQNSRIYVVGDPKQSIFSFQGADASVYQKAVSVILDQGGAGIPLDTNYRSAQPLVEAYNELFCSGVGCGVADDWFVLGSSGIRYQPVTPSGIVPNSACNGTVPNGLLAPIVFRKLYSLDENGRETRNKREKETLLAAWICSLVKYLTGSNGHGAPLMIPEGPNKAYRDLQLGDICVLVEKHREARHVMGLFRENGIPYSKQQNSGLFASDECLHLLVMLDAVDRPDSGVAVKKALLTEFFGLLPSDLGETPDIFGDTWQDQVETIRRFSFLRERERWGQLFGELYSRTALYANLYKGPDRKLRIAAYRQLRNYCLRRLIDRHLTLTELVTLLRGLNSGETCGGESRDEDVFQRETEGNSVRILTMHSAKGLEFPVVFVAGGKGVEKPTADYYCMKNDAGGTDFWFDKDMGKQRYTEARRQEIRRLYYVALTRAKYRLFVPLWDGFDTKSAAIATGKRGGDRSSASALFLSGMCHSVLEKKGIDSLFSVIGDDFRLPEVFGEKPHQSTDRRPVTVRMGDWVNSDGSQPLRPIERTTLQESYSGIVRFSQKLGVRANVGAHEPKTPSEDFPVRQNEILAPSAKTGDALHAILEQADFARWAAAVTPNDLLDGDPVARSLVERCLSEKGLLTGSGAIDKERINAAAEFVANSLNAAIPDPFGAGEIVLGKIDAAEMTPEAEFHFTFAQNGALFPPRDRAIGGWVLGFIDLMFRHKGRYYLLDWKSNWLPQGDYGADAIEQNMQAHHYDVQYKTYSLALHQWLGIRVADYDPCRHFGGVAYVYVRGTKPGQSCGIWTTRPGPGELETLWPNEIKMKLAQMLDEARGVSA